MTTSVPKRKLLLTYRGYEFRERVNPDSGVRITKPGWGTLDYARSIDEGKAWVDAELSGTRVRN